MIKTILVEDSELARIEMRNLLSHLDAVTMVGEATNGQEAISLVQSTSPDLILLDIHLPDMDGFQVLNEIDSTPQVIFTTAYDEHAVKSFDYNTIDYLLKPIKLARLQKAIAKIQVEEEEKPAFNLDNTIFIKGNDEFHIVQLRDIALFSTDGNYTKAFFKDEVQLIHKSLQQIEKRLDPMYFFRINRNQLINLNQIAQADKWFKGKLMLTLSNGEKVEVSERQSVKLKQRLSF